MRHVATPARRHEGAILLALVGIVLLTTAWAYDSDSHTVHPATSLQRPSEPTPLLDPTPPAGKPVRPTGRIRRTDAESRPHRSDPEPERATTPGHAAG